MLLHDVSSSFINIIPHHVLLVGVYIEVMCVDHILCNVPLRTSNLTLAHLMFMDIITKMRRNDSNNLQKMVFLAICMLSFFCITVFVVITIILRSLKLIQCNNNKVLIDADDAVAHNDLPTYT